jgi:hypothetical protein
MSRIGVEEEWEESGCWRKARFSSALVVAARMVHRGVTPVNGLQNWSILFGIMNKMVTHSLVVVGWTEVSFPDAQSLSNNMFAVIGAFDVIRVREELAINVPRMPAPEVRISMFFALTDWMRMVSTQLDLSGSRLTYLDSHPRV